MSFCYVGIEAFNSIFDFIGSIVMRNILFNLVVYMPSALMFPKEKSYRGLFSLSICLL